jgi:tRNA/tmRNA/rRNA uracil-C5-methylase (TrmA/RlmC/RlmD family)
MATERARTTATVRIEKVVAEGDGLGRLDDGRVVFVEGALPGELVEAHIVKQSRDYARAATTKVLESNPQRVDPPCRFVREGCGGCDLQHASVSLQREIKRDIVRESLARLGRIVDPDVRLPDVDVPSVGARTTVRVARSADGRVGFRRRRSHDVVTVDRCLIAHPGLAPVFTDLRLESAEEAVVRVSNHDGAVVVWAERVLGRRGSGVDDHRSGERRRVPCERGLVLPVLAAGGRGAGGTGDVGTRSVGVMGVGSVARRVRRYRALRGHGRCR